LEPGNPTVAAAFTAIKSKKEKMPPAEVSLLLWNTLPVELQIEVVASFPIKELIGFLPL